MKTQRSDPFSLGEWLHDAARELATVGVSSPRHDAERLAAHALGTGWGSLWSRLREPLSGAEIRRLGRALDRRSGGEPLAYLEGTAVFWGMEVRCGPGALVPRPETETLVAVSLGLLDGKPAPLVADIGTGTGAVALAILSERPDARIWATDVSEHALGYAEENLAAHGAAVDVVRGDLFSALPSRLCGRLDLVVSNPPYVPEDAPVPLDVGAEPGVALRAGTRGDDVLERLAAEAPVWLRSGGALAVEVGTAEQAARLASSLGSAFRRTGIGDDHTGRPRVVWATR